MEDPGDGEQQFLQPEMNRSAEQVGGETFGEPARKFAVRTAEELPAYSNKVIS